MVRLLTILVASTIAFGTFSVFSIPIRHNSEKSDSCRTQTTQAYHVGTFPNLKTLRPRACADNPSSSRCSLGPPTVERNSSLLYAVWYNINPFAEMIVEIMRSGCLEPLEEPKVYLRYARYELQIQEEGYLDMVPEREEMEEVKKWYVCALRKRASSSSESNSSKRERKYGLLNLDCLLRTDSFKNRTL
ncbi:hypothetical protein EV360DRAFT_78566 [Lentinula raphanica]|nr:hypothetical protein EV360DRAFT_78566 [Lentinula raphanica]